ncbi:diguanylate cyclase (GGDEF) domain-containing protein [Devosia lucknowensis]|uniref:Diguanylate cyclase (GGDEF) domain-containing protein n=1 Tax=Devosia lucknowensis TaxID=1096929 RepID=A0A1Y6GD03_9HYPH|nr:GGDEF domain-containing protein [Devosia lucknowensis]SMQ85680.1 diguanylate cyclase (GGDEF) domain-containing protein [Devosia lucknowensis]
MNIKPRLNAKDSDPGRALAPIRLLVLGAFLSAVLACTALFVSVLHVMSTTDELSMAEERMRATRIAEIIPHLPADQLPAAIAAMGRVAGLRALTLAPQPAAGEDMQSIPLLGEPLGGQFLSWRAERPGKILFETHAPTRVPLILGLIAMVLICLLAMLRYVRRLERQRRDAERQALRDHLTGLPNRLALDEELSRLADEGAAFSVLAFDLDRFKPINDLFGHHAGDLALIEIGQRLALQLRPGEILARVGGDEFVAVVRRDDPRTALAQLARDCIAAVGRPIHAVGANVTVGVSIGLVEDGGAHPPAALLKRVDRALYEAKRMAGSAFCFSGDKRRQSSGGRKGSAQARDAA